MTTYYVKTNEIYTITSTAECVVYDASGVEVLKCPANANVNIKATTNKLKLSDDNAAIKKAVNDSGGAMSEECVNHIADDNVHVTSSDKSKLANVAQLNKENIFSGANRFNAGTSFYGGTYFDANAAFNNTIDIYGSVNMNKDLMVCGTAAGNYGLYVNNYYTTKIFGVQFKYDGTTNSTLVTKPDSGQIEQTSILNKAECDSLYGCLVGEVKWYAGSRVPDGWLLCDGSAYHKSNYPKLYAAIEDTWGAGAAEGYFKVPNLIDRVPWGSDRAGGYIDAGLPNITGTLSVGNDVRGYNDFSNLSGAFSVIQNTLPIPTNTTGAGANTQISYELKLDASKSNAIYGKSSTVQPPAAKLIPIIKY